MDNILLFYLFVLINICNLMICCWIKNNVMNDHLQLDDGFFDFELDDEDDEEEDYQAGETPF